MGFSSSCRERDVLRLTTVDSNCEALLLRMVLLFFVDQDCKIGEKNLALVFEKPPETSKVRILGFP